MAVKKPMQGCVAAKNLPGAKSRTQLLFLDDLNCAAVDAFEIQPPLELLRQILSQGNNSFSRYVFLLYGDGICRYVISLDCVRVCSPCKEISAFKIGIIEHH